MKTRSGMASGKHTQTHSIKLIQNELFLVSFIRMELLFCLEGHLTYRFVYYYYLL